MEAAEVVDGSVAEDAHENPPQQEPDAVEPTPAGMALVASPQIAGQIISAEKPAEIIGKATEIATALKHLIDSQGLAVSLGGSRKHVEVGGWQALGTMLGALGGQPLHAETVWTRPVKGDDGKAHRTTYLVNVKRYHRKDQGGGLREELTYEVDGFDWEAKVEIRTAGGVIVGSADAMVSRAESTWAQRDDYALRSMAETRAESRAYRRACGWIINLAGYSPTPAEEMGGGDAQGGTVEIPDWAQPGSEALTNIAKKAIKYLTASENGKAAEAWADLLPGEGLPMPRIVAQAIVKIATLVQKREKAGAQDAAAEQPDPPAPADPPATPAAQDGPPPAGVCYVTDEAPAGLPPERARKVTIDAAKRICQCEGGWEAAEARIANAPKEPASWQTDDACPMWNHGIPF